MAIDKAAQYVQDSGRKIMDDVTRGYLECALWASYDDEETPLNELFNLTDFTPEDLFTATQVCHAFMAENLDDLANCTIYRNHPDFIGHDLWLTRNGHGAGFWDRGLGDIGDRLSDSAHRLGEITLIVGDDGRPCFE